jgi:hypothetical protein
VLYPGVVSVIDHSKQIVNMDFDDGDKAIGVPFKLVKLQDGQFCDETLSMAKRHTTVKHRKLTPSKAGYKVECNLSSLSGFNFTVMPNCWYLYGTSDLVSSVMSTHLLLGKHLSPCGKTPAMCSHLSVLMWHVFGLELFLDTDRFRFIRVCPKCVLVVPLITGSQFPPIVLGLGVGHGDTWYFNKKPKPGHRTVPVSGPGLRSRSPMVNETTPDRGFSEQDT